MKYVEVRTQAELDAAVRTQAELDAALKQEGVIPEIRGDGFFEVRGDATVHAGGSSTVRAGGSSTMHARGSSTVRAGGSSTVHASRYVAVHRLSKTAKITGGVIIERPHLGDAAGWLEYHGLKPTKSGKVVVYKAVDENFRSGYGWDYSPGSKPEAPSWKPTDSCGDGLHFSPTPVHALGYHRDATRFVACTIEVKDLVPITDYSDGSDKCKAPRALKCVEVTIDGKLIK